MYAISRMPLKMRSCILCALIGGMAANIFVLWLHQLIPLVYGFHMRSDIYSMPLLLKSSFPERDWSKTLKRPINLLEADRVRSHVSLKEDSSNEPSRPVFPDIKHILENNSVVLFMKGTPEEPMCGFSGTVVKALQLYRRDKFYHYINVLEDDAMRKGVKEYTGWPTIPQLFVKGAFIGGCDVIVEMYRDGSLKKTLDETLL